MSGSAAGVATVTQDHTLHRIGVSVTDGWSGNGGNRRLGVCGRPPRGRRTMISGVCGRPPRGRRTTICDPGAIFSPEFSQVLSIDKRRRTDVKGVFRGGLTNGW